MRINILYLFMMTSTVVGCSSKEHNTSDWGGLETTHDADGSADADGTDDDTATDDADGSADADDTDDDTGTDDADSDSDGSAPVSIDLMGDWVDGWGSTHSISDDTWSYDGIPYHISVFDNDVNFAVAENGVGAWVVGWSRFDWATDADGNHFYCQTTYDAATEEAALAATISVATDLTTGCGTGGFPWTALTSPADDTGSEDTAGDDTTTP
jgi:hypothetical protein